MMVPDPAGSRSSTHGGSAMSVRGARLARAIESFVENPVTNLAKGVALLLIGLTDASRTFREDVAHGQVRVGHGLIIIGLFSILGALPHIIDGLEAGSLFFESRAGQGRAKKDEND